MTGLEIIHEWIKKYAINEPVRGQQLREVMIELLMGPMIGRDEMTVAALFYKHLTTPELSDCLRFMADVLCPP